MTLRESNRWQRESSIVSNHPHTRFTRVFEKYFQLSFRLQSRTCKTMSLETLERTQRGFTSSFSHGEKSVLPCGRRAIPVLLGEAGVSLVETVQGTIHFRLGREKRETDRLRKEVEYVNRRRDFFFVAFKGASGVTRRVELGKFLLGTTHAVRRKNADPLDYRIENLEVKLPGPSHQKKPKYRHKTRRAKRPTRKEIAARPYLHDGLNRTKRLALIGDPTWLANLERFARATARDLRGDDKYLPEKRGPEIVQRVLCEMLPRIRRGQIWNVTAFARKAVSKQAKIERKKRACGLPPGPRDKAADRWARKAWKAGMRLTQEEKISQGRVEQ
jgi:hypothetical protein